MVAGHQLKKDWSRANGLPWQVRVVPWIRRRNLKVDLDRCVGDQIVGFQSSSVFFLFFWRGVLPDMDSMDVIFTSFHVSSLSLSSGS